MWIEIFSPVNVTLNSLIQIPFYRKHNSGLFLRLPNKHPDLSFDHNSRCCIRWCSKQPPQLLWRNNGSFYRPRKRLVRFHMGISDCRRQNIWQRVNGQWRHDYVEQLQLPIHPRGLLVLYRGCANSPWTRGHCTHPGYFRKPSARGRMVKF